MLIVLIPITIGIVMWAYTLVRRGRPTWVRWIGIVCALITALASAITLYELYRAHEAREAANRATEMAESIAVALNTVAVGGMCAIAAIVVLAYFTLRKPSRSPWSVMSSRAATSLIRRLP